VDLVVEGEQGGDGVAQVRCVGGEQDAVGCWGARG
jgi:hypothetical protein